MSGSNFNKIVVEDFDDVSLLEGYKVWWGFQQRPDGYPYNYPYNSSLVSLRRMRILSASEESCIYKLINDKPAHDADEDFVYRMTREHFETEGMVLCEDREWLEIYLKF